MSERAEWCGRCYRRRLSDDGASALLVELGRFDEPDRFEPPQRPRPATTLRSVYSRWRAGATAFGPAGRVGLTAALLVPWTVSVAMLSSGLGRMFLIVYVGMTAPALLLLLPAIWRRERSATLLEPAMRCRVCAWGVAADAQWCPRCSSAVH